MSKRKVRGSLPRHPWRWAVVLLSAAVILVFATRPDDGVERGAKEPEPAVPNRAVTAPDVVLEPTLLPTAGELAAVDTSGWMVYENSLYGFSLGYPADWQVVPEGDYQVRFFVPGASTASAATVSIAMRQADSVEEFLPARYSEKNRLELDGMLADMYAGVPAGDAEVPSAVSTSVLGTHGGRAFALTFLDRLEDVEDGKQLAVFYKMLESFRFLKRGVE